MLPYRVYLDRHDLPDDAPGASVCKAAFAAYHEAEAYAKALTAAWLDAKEPVVIRIAGARGNMRYFPLRASVEEYGTYLHVEAKLVAQKQPVGTIGVEPQEGSMK